MHVHIDNSTALGEIFEISVERLTAALDRHDDIAAELEVTIGHDGEGLDKALQTAEVLFAWNVPREQLSKRAPELKLIQVQGAGVNHLLPLDWVPPEVTLTNSSGAHGSRASEYLIMALLALNCALPSMVSSQAKRQWKPVNNASIQGKTVLIYGVGAIGGDCAAQAKKFGLNVLGIRRSGSAHPDVDEMHTPDQLRALLPRADFVVVCAPHTKETEGAFGPAEFELINEGAGFIAYSRSKLIDYDALCKRLRANTLSAVVDVFDEEPLPAESEYWGVPNLIITPHSSSNDPVNHASRSLDLLFDNIRRSINDEPLANIIDPELQY